MTGRPGGGGGLRKLDDFVAPASETEAGKNEEGDGQENEKRPMGGTVAVEYSFYTCKHRPASDIEGGNESGKENKNEHSC